MCLWFLKSTFFQPLICYILVLLAFVQHQLDWNHLKISLVLWYQRVLNFNVLRSFLALRGWIQGSNNEDLSKRPCTFFANKTLPRADTCRPKELKTKGGTLGWKKYFFQKSSQISTRIGSKDQKFFTDSKNIYINWCWCIN